MNSGLVREGIESTNVYNADYKCIDVLPQDHTYIGFNLYLCSVLAQTTLSANAVLNANTVTVTSATNITAGKVISIYQGARIYQSLVTNVTGTTLTLASPIDFAFLSGSTVCVGNWNLNQNGATIPVTFKIQPPSGVKFHITAISVTITDDGTMDDSKFGSLTALTNGILARRVDGTTYNYFLITNNRGFYQYGYDYQYNDRAGGTGAYGFLARKDLRKVNGNVISLDGATLDELQFIVRDNLTTLTEFTIQAHGHIVEG